MFKFYARPNANTYTESLRFDTTIFESVNGNENSRQNLVDYKYRVKYSSMIFTTSRHRAFLNLFRQGLTSTVLHPLWGQPAFVTQTLSNTTSVPCTHHDSEFKIGDEIFVGYGFDEFNIVTLVDIVGDNLIIDEAIDIHVGVVVLPSFIGYISGDINTTYSGENYALCEIFVEEMR